MRLSTNILTLLTALCLFGSGSNWAAQGKDFDQMIVETATQVSTAAHAMFVPTDSNEQLPDPRLARITTPRQSTQSSFEALLEPSFLKLPILFTPNRLNLTATSRNTLNCAAAWLREHHLARILIVGYCDNSGSEVCTTALAERRAEVVRQFLMSLGTRTDQIAGVKGWENLDQPCHSNTKECQRQNRSVRLFLTSPLGV
jgi:outer membrane protein OmpA-like peptidoglycan-associated protein